MMLSAVVVASFACSHAQRVRLSVNVSTDANDDRPIPVDLVFVWDKKTASQLGEISAKDWFAKKPQLQRDDPNQRLLAVREWEWVPGQAIPSIDLDMRASAWRWVRAVFLFANYRSDGPHRLRIEPGTIATLDFGRDDVRLSTLDARRPNPVKP